VKIENKCFEKNLPLLQSLPEVERDVKKAFNFALAFFGKYLK
jgi:hypothetical protein